ncbi:gliding motility-associated C-terminal domain-containing protein [Hufsiella ginkgonis]|uniref:PKD domain-containing protein n=1 Tax=Hufsiella ginkgonis TaxID=2695274 RepID=A0A7K1Y3R5_9SPHI|nr:PKD domain-containing protein [Hufsiella ginkgonis]MXV17891.1 PKD domain-containing protein [Hufsiella ginkgonis]
MEKKLVVWMGIILACLAIGPVFGQGTSNKGTDFWVAYTGHVDGTRSRLTLFLTSQKEAVVNINAGGTDLAPVTVPANQAVPVVIDPNVYGNVYIGGSDQVVPHSGIHVTSDVPIVVYSHIAISARSAATLIFPTKSLGKEYYTIAFNQSLSTATETKLSEFTIVGVEDATEVKITPSQASINATHAKDVPFTITLNKGDIYQYQSVIDITGSRIETVGSCKPLAVFSGSTKNGFCESGNPATSGEDNLYQQLLPLTAWGKNFVTAPFYNTVHGATDIFRIIVGADNTTIKVNGSVVNANATRLNNPYAKGSVITFTSQTANTVEADHPISLTQFQTTQSCNPNNTAGRSGPYVGDPEMTVLNPIEQTLSDVTVYSAVSRTDAPTAIESHYINIILLTSDIPNLNIDGQAIPANQFVAINNQYSYLIYDVTGSSKINPSHRITSKQGFVAIAYGYGQYESYGYLAGSDLKNLNAFIEPKLLANNTTVINSGCTKQSYSFSLRLPYITTNIKWDLGNGTFYEDTNPAYITETGSSVTTYKYAYTGPVPARYTEAKTYTVKADVLNPSPSGCDPHEEITFGFDIFDPPIASFTAPAEACAKVNVEFKDTSREGGKKNTSWLWDFGDNTKSTDQNPVHAYAAGNKTYTVTLITTGESGCESLSATKTIRVNSLPVPKFEYTKPACETKPMIFTDASATVNGTITAWTWNFGDGSPEETFAGNAPVSHTYASAGTYQVTLKLTTSLGCTDISVAIPVKVEPLPKVDFQLPDYCLDDQNAVFTNKTTIADNSALTYEWDFGDRNANSLRPNLAANRNASHQYTETGYYTVRLKVISAAGCEVTLAKEFRVNGSVPVPAFSVINAATLCSTEPVSFKDESSVKIFGELTRIEWYYDADGHPLDMEADEDPGLRSAPKTYTHRYPAFHTETVVRVKVKMKVFSGGSCFNEVDKVIELKGVPEVVFGPIPSICQEKTPVMLNQAHEKTGLFSGHGEYSGRGVSKSGLFNPAVAGPGTHTITYTWFGGNGCIGQQTATVEVYPSPTAAVAEESFRLLEGNSKMLIASSAVPGVTYKWTPSAGLDHDDIPNPVASPTDDVIYTVTVSSPNQCTASATVNVKVLKLPLVPNAFTPNGDGINDTWNIKYLADYPGATVEVFNRYGEKVFSQKGYAAGWDGKTNGYFPVNGTYYYIIDPKNGRKPIYGSVAIIR